MTQVQIEIELRTPRGWSVCIIRIFDPQTAVELAFSDLGDGIYGQSTKLRDSHFASPRVCHFRVPIRTRRVALVPKPASRNTA